MKDCTSVDTVHSQQLAKLIYASMKQFTRTMSPHCPYRALTMILIKIHERPYHQCSVVFFGMSTSQSISRYIQKARRMPV